MLCWQRQVDRYRWIHDITNGFGQAAHTAPGWRAAGRLCTARTFYAYMLPGSFCLTLQAPGAWDEYWLGSLTLTTLPVFVIE